MTDTRPKAMEGFIGNGLHVLETVNKIPSVMFKACSGVILLSATETGFVFSGQTGAGVAMKRHGDEWSLPVAVTIGGVGVGAVFGYADKDIVIILNPLAMTRLLEGKGSMKVGVDLGFSLGKTGGDAGIDIAGSDKGGFGTSFVYTYSKGIYMSIQVESCIINNVGDVNEAFYGTHDAKAIIEGEDTAKVPEGDELVAKLHAAIKKKQHKTATEEAAEEKGDEAMAEDDKAEEPKAEEPKAEETKDEGAMDTGEAGEEVKLEDTKPDEASGDAMKE